MTPATHERPRARLLLVEDDDQLADLLVEYLRPHGFDIARVSAGDAGASRILSDRPDVVVLDLMLPGTNGLDVCRRVRPQYAGAILMLTASQSEVDHVAGLELGADDFVTKPIEPRVLLARIRRQLRRLDGEHAGGRPAGDGALEVSTLRVDPVARAAHVAGSPVPLTTMEFEVLLRLARNAGTVVARDELYTQVLGVAYDGLDRGMDVHVSRLKAVRGVGYLLAPR